MSRDARRQGRAPDGEGRRPDGKRGPEAKSGKRRAGRAAARQQPQDEVVERQPAPVAASSAPPSGWGAAPASGRCPVSAVMRRHGLRRRLSAVLIIAALGPVIAVSAVAVLLIFSSVEQGIEFEAVRGLQVARGLFLQQVQQLAGGRGRARRRRGAAARAGGGAGLGAPAPGRAVAGDARTRCSRPPTPRAASSRAARAAAARTPPSAAAGALEPADRSPVILRALGYERTVSVERARDRLVVRAALPLVDPAMRMLGDGGRHGGRSTARSSTS